MASTGEFRCAVIVRPLARSTSLRPTRSFVRVCTTDAGVPPPGEVRCFGYENGDGATKVPSDLGLAIAVAVTHKQSSCAILANKTVRCWGSNYDGQCTPPADLGPVRALTGGVYRSTFCAIQDATGLLKCWGRKNPGS